MKRNIVTLLLLTGTCIGAESAQANWGSFWHRFTSSAEHTGNAIKASDANTNRGIETAFKQVGHSVQKSIQSITEPTGQAPGAAIGYGYGEHVSGGNQAVANSDAQKGGSTGQSAGKNIATPKGWKNAATTTGLAAVRMQKDLGQMGAETEFGLGCMVGADVVAGPVGGAVGAVACTQIGKAVNEASTKKQSFTKAVANNSSTTEGAMGGAGLGTAIGESVGGGLGGLVGGMVGQAAGGAVADKSGGSVGSKINAALNS